MTDHEHGPPEQVYFKCASCRLFVETFWAPGGRGLLPGDYILVADWIYHPDCWKRIENEMPTMR